MTVPTDAAQPPRVSYIEDGATVVRSIPFTFQDPTDLVITRIAAGGAITLLALGSDYSISGGAGAVGSATMFSAGVLGDTIRIDRDTPHGQLSHYEPTDDFPPERIEGDLDKLMRIIQELARDLLKTSDIQQIIATMLTAGAGITITLDPATEKLTIASNVDVFGILAGALFAGDGVTLTVDTTNHKVIVSADGIENLPDCVELSGDQQTNTGGGSGTAGYLTATDVVNLIHSTLVAGTGINLVWDAANNQLDVVNSSPAGYTDENARDAIGAALRGSTLISIAVNDAGDTIEIDCSALDPSYRGLKVVSEAGSFDFDDTHGGRSILYTGGPASATLRANSVHALSDGWGTVVRNKGTGTLTLAFDAGVSIEVNGATVAAASIGLAVGAVATINRWGADDFTLNGNSKVSST